MELDKVIRYLQPNAEFVIYGETLEGLEFVDKAINKPTQKQVSDAWLQIQKDQQNKIETEAIMKQALLDKLGITADEAKLLLG